MKTSVRSGVISNPSYRCFIMYYRDWFQEFLILQGTELAEVTRCNHTITSIKACFLWRKNTNKKISSKVLVWLHLVTLPIALMSRQNKPLNFIRDIYFKLIIKYEYCLFGKGIRWSWCHTFFEKPKVNLWNKLKNEDPEIPNSNSNSSLCSSC